MAQTGDSFIVTLGPSHLGWGEYRYTDSRDIIYGKAYIPILVHHARMYKLYNSNFTNGQDILGKNIFNCRTEDGYSVCQLKSQGFCKKKIYVLRIFLLMMI